MATITTDTYLDSAARTAGETMTISSGATLTIRTDSRLHATAPASRTGSMASVGFSDIGGTYSIDATDVRWLSYNSGSGSLPAIGTSVTQGGVAGYFLGIWETYSSAPTTTTVPTSGYIKFREVTGGAFSAGALGGITASATGADVVGWIELVYDAATNFTIPRVGKFLTRGSWFELGTTNGSVGQQLVVPTTSATITNNFLPGVWVETSSGSGVYEYWQGLSKDTVGWKYTHIGQPRGSTDGRVKFVKTAGSGVAQFSEDVDVSGTYSSTMLTGTYVQQTLSATYTWADNVMTVSTGGTVHLLETGMQVGLSITSGSGTTNTYTITFIDSYTFTVPLTGSGTGGNVTVRSGLTITSTGNALNAGESIYCDFTSGTATDGTYNVWRTTSATAYVINYPTTNTITSGNVECYYRVTVSCTAHGLAIGNTVKCDFTTGGGVDGIYPIFSVLTDSFTLNVPHTASISGNVTLQFTVGHTPPTGCKVRIPNIFIAECATASRNTNSIPNATTTSRPEITTTTAGALDLEYIYSLSLYTGSVGQAYSCRLYHCAFMDNLAISEIATAIDIDDVGVGMYSIIDARAINFTSCFAGGTIKNVVAQRGNVPGSSDHAFELVSCFNVELTNVIAGIIQYARSTGYSITISTCQNITMNNSRCLNGSVNIIYSTNITVNDIDQCDRYIGYTNSTTGYSTVTIGSGCDQIMVDGVSFGLNGLVPNCHPYTYIVYASGATNITVRNLGTHSNPLNTGTWLPNLYNTGYAIAFIGNNINVRAQKIYVTRVRTNVLYSINTNNNVLYDRIIASDPYIGSGTGSPTTVITNNIADLNCNAHGVTTGAYPVSGQSSVYGTHFYDLFLGTTKGIILLVMNEPTVITNDYITIVSGANVKFTSAGAIMMYSVGDQVIWEMSYYSEGHSSFANTTPVMTGGTIGNYTLEYKIDLNDDNGYNGSWLTLNTTNLTTHDISNGFKLMIRITTGTSNTSNVSHLRIYTNTTSTLQGNISYPLDVASYSVTVLDIITGDPVQNARVFITSDSGGDLPYQASISITRSGSVATVTHTGHGLENNSSILISGSNQSEYNGVKTITYISENSYSFVVSGTPDTPATGTILCTTIIMNTLTNSNGIASGAISLTSDQPITGHVRLSTGSTHYKTSPLLGTIDQIDGLSLTVQLLPD